MKSPIIRTKNTWSLLKDASAHFVRNIGLYFVLSILPFVGIYVGTYFLISHTNSFWILFASLSLFLFVYGATMHISWESIWNAKLTLQSALQCLLHKVVKFQLTIILFWMLEVISIILSLGFVLKSYKHLNTTRKLGFNTSLILLFITFALSLICLYTFLFNDFIQTSYILVFLVVLGVSLISSTRLLLIPPISLFEGYGPLRAFNHSVQLSFDYKFHLLPFRRLQAIASFFIILISIIISFLLKHFIGWNLPHQTSFLAGLLFMVSVPFFLNLRVFYYQDLILREEGYNSLLTLRERYKSKANKVSEGSEVVVLSNVYDEYFISHSKITK